MDNILKKWNAMYAEEVIDDDTSHDISGDDWIMQYDFKMPIEYTKARALDTQVKSDIEFQGKDNLFSILLDPATPSLLLNKWSTIYTTDTSFLKDNQKLLKSYEPMKNKMHLFAKEYVSFKQEQNFLGKYQYIQFRRLFFLNTIVGFLQILALYNICSPLFTLLSPFIGLILPYFVLYFKGITIGFRDYLKMIKAIIFKNKIIHNLLNFRGNSIQQNLYTLGYLFIYGMGIYSNIQSCIQFYKNTNYMMDFNTNYGQFLDDGNHLIHYIRNKTKHLKSFDAFNVQMMKHQTSIQKMSIAIASLKQEQRKFMKCGNIGLLMKCHFDLFYNTEYNDTILYLIYLNQYHQDTFQLSTFVKNRQLMPCTFSKKKGNTKIKQMYYLPHIHDDNVKNDIHFNKNIIITGPNASGKTTIIKSTIMNLFLSQSLGFGCYQKCKTKVYHYFHSYLNIPDTSNRDSLFQAEARRCKTIFEHIQKHKSQNHLCIFDEIYSGTNPKDAVLCANIYLNGMNHHKHHVDYVLTTHYLELCDKFKKHSHVKNQQMKVNTTSENDAISYTYLLEDGISHVHGGYQILEKMDYPEELLERNNIR